MVMPDESEQDILDSWEGSINQVTKFNTKYCTKIQASLTKQIDFLFKDAEQSSRRDLAQDKDLKKSVNQLVMSVQEKQNSSEVSFEEQLESQEREI